MSRNKTNLHHLPIAVHKEENLHEDLLLIIKEIRPDWEKQEIKFKESPNTVSNGIINKMVAAYVISPADDGIMCRIYGEGIREYIAQKEETDYIQLLRESYNFVPRILLTFENGYCYDFIDGEILTPKTIQMDPVWKIVAKQTAQMHSFPIPKDLQIRSKLIEFYFKEIEAYPEKLADETLNLRFQKEFPSKSSYLEDQKKLITIIQSLDIPLVLIHGDLRPENMIWNEKTEQVTFVDFECASYDYQTMDIAYHFFRFAGIHNCDYSLFPSESFQREWLNVYLNEFFSGKSEKITTKTVETLRVKVLKTYLLLLLINTGSGPSCCDNSLVKDIPFDIFEFSARTYKEYQRVQDYIMALVLP